MKEGTKGRFDQEKMETGIQLWTGVMFVPKWGCIELGGGVESFLEVACFLESEYKESTIATYYFFP